MSTQLGLGVQELRVFRDAAEMLQALILLCFGSRLSWEVSIVAKDCMMEVLIT